MEHEKNLIQVQHENLESRIKKQVEQISDLKRKLDEANEEMERLREKTRNEKMYTASDLANVRAELEAQFVRKLLYNLNKIYF